MNLAEVWNFLRPEADTFQWLFLSIIVGLTGVTIFFTWRLAKPAYWERKWNRGTPDDLSDDLDIDHGSVTDLCHAVETWPEKLASVMPGMLLVVGLLGTFVGLGVALNHASHIMGQPNALSASGAASSMQDLMGMLQGLGTKFKTSTWGILGFLILTIWSRIRGFEEERLSWVIGKVKSELEKRKKADADAVTAKQKALFAQIIMASNGIVTGVVSGLTQQMTEKQNALFAQVTHASDVIVSGIVAGFSQKITEAMEQERLLHQSALHNLNANIENIRSDLLEGVKATSETNATMNILVTESKSLREQVIQASDVVVSGIVVSLSQKISEAMEQERLLHQSALHNLNAVIENIRSDLLEGNKATSATSAAMNNFVLETESLITNMASSAQNMGNGANQVGVAASALLGAVGDFRAQFTDVLEGVRTGLGEAIASMSAQASQTLERGSRQLGDATKEISTALGLLSSDVKETMSAVEDSINKSLEMQIKSSNSFTESSQTLNENVAATTGLVEKLGGDITSGLSAVSGAGQTMIGIGKSLQTSIKNTQELPDVLRSLEIALTPLKASPNQQDALLTEIKGLRIESKSHGDIERQQILDAMGTVVTGIKELRVVIETNHRDISLHQPALPLLQAAT